ncbi:MAG TPA: DnaA N-terminal domain-containing protein, partial [Gemmataceae bacterium]|nr:DnaA N-terminal domain-containing protein [Gemmataceae bacterium]
MTASEREIVASLGKAIAQRIGEPRYNLWFTRNTKFMWNGDHLVVGVPNHFYQEWLQSTFAEAVRDAAHEILGRPMQIRFAIDPELFQAARHAQAAVDRAQDSFHPDKL